MQIVIHCDLQLKAGTRAQLVEEIKKHDLENRVLMEAGNIDYYYAIPVNDKNSLRIVEAWESEDALSEHRQSENIKVWHSIADKYIIGRSHHKYSAEKIENHS